jgi:WD40 repeat protein/beta-lactamase regulating signal transducer with metallopeptidase domain
MYVGLANAACAAALAFVAVAVGSWGRRPALAHCIWLLVLIKLVTPPLFPFSLAWLPPTTEAATKDEVPSGPLVAVVTPEPESVGPPTPGDVWIEMEKTRAKFTVVKQKVVGPDGEKEAAVIVRQDDVQPAPESFAYAPPPAPNPPPEVTPARADPLTSAAMFLGATWLIGSAAWYVRAVRRLARFQRMLRHSRPAPERVREIAERIAGQFGLRRCPDVSLLPAPLPPMVWAAFGRPRVLLPASLVERLDDDQLAALLAHELAHVCRGDHWVRRLEFLVIGLYWWYPLAWWARGRLQAAEEECCDAWVVESLPANSYASAIVTTVEFLAAGNAAAPALASGLGRLDTLKRRLTLILTGTRPKRLNVVGRLAVAALALGLLPLLPTLARSQKTPNEKAEEQEAAKQEAQQSEEEAIAFQPNPLALTGGSFDVFSLAVSPDGRYLAAGSGYWDRPGEVRVRNVADHKEVLAFTTAKGVASVAFSPDGRFIGTAGYDNQATVREFPSGKVVQVLPLDGAARMAFSPDKKTIATATEANTVKLWDLATGKELARLDGDLYRWHCLAFSHDGKLLAVGGGEWNGDKLKGQVNFWDTETHKLVGKLTGHAQPVLCLAFSPDKKTIATGANDATVRLWQLDGFKEIGAMEGHDSWVEGVAFTPDGGTVISSSHDGTVRLWDAAKRTPVTRLDGHVPPVRTVAVSHDGKQLFTGGAARMLKAWDLTTHKELAHFQPKSGPVGEESIVLATAYSPDGKLLATAHENGAITLRNAANGDYLRTLEGHEDGATCLAFTKDGKTMISGGVDHTVRLWEVETGKLRAKLEGHTSWVYALALSRDGKTLASGGYDKTVRLWDMESLKEKATLTGHKGAVRALAFAPDGKTLASGGGDHAIKLWDVESQKEKTLTGHEGTVRSLAYAPDGKTLVSGSEDATVRLWNADGTERVVLKGHNGKVSAVGFSPRGRYVVSAGMDNTVRLWDAAAGTILQTLRGHNDAVSSLAWAPDGRFLVTAGHDRSLRLWVVTTGTLRMLSGHTGPVKSAAFSPDGKYVASCGGWPNGDKTLRLWDVQTGKEARKFEGHKGQVNCVAFSPDGKTILSGGTDNILRLHNVESGEMLREWKGHAEQIISVSFSADGKSAVTASHDKTVRVWDLDRDEPRLTLEGHKDWVRGAVFAADGKKVVSAGRDATVRVWDAEKGTELKCIELMKRPDMPKVVADTLAVSPDGKRVAVGHGPAVRVFDVESGEQVRQFDGHGSGVIGVAFSPDGKSVLSGSYDATARLWDVETGRELHVFRGHRNWVWAVDISKDGKRLLTAGGGAKNGEQYVPGNDFAIRVWPLPDTSATVARTLKLKVKTEK